jgi:hypothetical protein
MSSKSFFLSHSSLLRGRLEEAPVFILIKNTKLFALSSESFNELLGRLISPWSCFVICSHVIYLLLVFSKFLMKQTLRYQPPGHQARHHLVLSLRVAIETIYRCLYWTVAQRPQKDQRLWFAFSGDSNFT